MKINDGLTHKKNNLTWLLYLNNDNHKLTMVLLN